MKRKQYSLEELQDQELEAILEVLVRRGYIEKKQRRDGQTVYRPTIAGHKHFGIQLSQEDKKDLES